MVTGTAQRSGRRADHRRPRRRRASTKWFARAALCRLRPAYPRPGRTGRRRWLPSWRQLLGGFAASTGLAALSLTVAYAATDIPRNLNSYATQQDTVYFWSDGTPMARTGWVRRQAMPLKDIPEDVRRAVLAAENESFYSDPGISFKGLFRALWRTVGEGVTEGGSTITQQYAKGIQRAAQAYYGTDVTHLNASQSAFLASLLKGAGLYGPTLSRANHKRAVERWSWILDRMVETGKLSPAERATYKKFPEPLKTARAYDTGKQSDYLVELAQQYAKKAAHLSDQQFDLGGYQIYTTFDRERETALTDAVAKGRSRAKKEKPEAARTVHYGAASVATDGRILAVHGGPDHRAQGFNESNAATVQAGSAFLPFVYAAGLEHGVRKTRGGPVTRITPQTVYDGDSGVAVTTPEGPYWDRSGKKVTAHNDDGKSYGPISLGKALARSVNTPFMQLGMDTGLNEVRETAIAAGLLPSSLGPQVPALSLGSSTPSAIRMAGGYATFAAAGKHTEPYSVRRITHNGAEVRLSTPTARRAIGAEVAEQVSQALTDSLNAAHPAVSTATAAGKSGTTADDTAAWYTGTAQAVSTAVVVYRMDLAGSLDPLPLNGIAGTPAGSVPFAIWSGAMGLD
ncbi:transglycosylase domain-containing protein [Streptomyces sp. NPDC001351]|uniref:transglycosylase domain-containing protein n=1 Tax=Streptomyces sp. NPDC001351 TaxID=3364564 RepID=UPI0036C2C79E